jgi:hypothetical protein
VRVHDNYNHVLSLKSMKDVFNPLALTSYAPDGVGGAQKLIFLAMQVITVYCNHTGHSAGSWSCT